MHLSGCLRTITIHRIQFANDLFVSHTGDQTRPDTKSIALRPTKRNSKPVLLRETIVENLQRATAGLSHDEILAPIIVHIGRDDAASITVGIRAGEMADVHEVGAAAVEVGAISLVAAQVVILRDIKRITRPEFTEFIIQYGWSRNLATSLKRLRHDSLPDAWSSVRPLSRAADKTRCGVKIEESVVIQIDHGRRIGPADRRNIVVVSMCFELEPAEI